MNLDRNEPGNNGKGKYALILLRKIKVHNHLSISEIAQGVADEPSAIDLGLRHSDSEFFVIRLKDKYAAAALEAYAKAIFDDIADSKENISHLNTYAAQILMMAERAKRHPARKLPD